MLAKRVEEGREEKKEVKEVGPLEKARELLAKRRERNIGSRGRALFSGSHGRTTLVNGFLEASPAHEKTL